MIAMNRSHREIIVILGKPASGKGTQAVSLSAKLGLPYVSMGALLRNEIARKTDIGRRIKSIIAKGDLVPNEVTNALIGRRLRRDDSKHGIILDGCPRNIVQAHLLEKVADVKHALLISITDAEVIRRITNRLVCPVCGENYNKESRPPKKKGFCDKCGAKLATRTDDKPKVIRERLKSYRRDTLPVLRYYRQKRVLRRVDGMGTIAEVTARTAEALKTMHADWDV